MYITRAEIKLYLNKGILLGFCLLVLLLAAVGAVAGRMLERNSLFPPFLLYVVDSDGSGESAMLTDALKNYGGVSMTVEVTADEAAALDAVSAGKAAGAILIPGGFFADILSGKNSDAVLAINQKNPFVSSVLALFARGMQEELAAAQSGIYTVLSQAQSSQERERYGAQANLIFFSMFAGRNMAEETVDLFGGTSAKGYYSIAFAVFMMMMLSPLFVRRGSVLKRQQLVSLLEARGVTMPRFFCYRLFAVLAVYAVLNIPVMVFLGWIGVLGGMKLPGIFLLYLLMLTWEGAFCSFCLWLFDDVKVAGIAIFLAGIAMLFFSGGVVPLTLMPDELKRFAFLTPNYYLNSLFISARAGEGILSNALMVLLFSLIFIGGAYFTGYARRKAAQG